MLVFERVVSIKYQMSCCVFYVSGNACINRAYSYDDMALQFIFNHKYGYLFDSQIIGELLQFVI